MALEIESWKLEVENWVLNLKVKFNFYLLWEQIFNLGINVYGK